MKLIIANKTYSSWSLRAWLAVKASGHAFEEELILLREPETEEIKALQRELEKADYHYGESKRELTSAENELRYVESDLDLYRYKLEGSKKQLAIAESEEDKRKAQEFIDEQTRTIAEIEANKVKDLADIEDIKADISKWEIELKAAEAKLKAARQGKLDTIEGDYRTKINESKNNIEFLKTKAGYLSLNIAKTLDDLITDYEDGIADEREVFIANVKLDKKLDIKVLSIGD
jgi:predicted  nucleic acid-binding Zn-ribbon protein